MSANLNLALTLSLNDRLVAPLQRALKEVEGGVKAIEKELNATNRAGAQADQTLAGMQGPAAAAREAANLARNTKNAVSMAERLKSAFHAAGNVIKGISTSVAAFQAMKFVVAQPLEQARNYDLQLAHLANVAYSDLPPEQRAAKRGDLNQAIKTSVMTGGGSRDSALEALNTMMASGVVTEDQAKKLLPMVQKYATAGDVESTTMADIAVKMLQAGFKLPDIPQMFDEALAAGQLGGFELKDMGKWLPKLIPAAAKSGLGGREGFRRVLAAAQMSINTAGSPDEAGNNLVDTLLQMTSQATQRNGVRLTKHGAAENIDVAGSLAAARAKGTDTLSAFVNLVEHVGRTYPQYVALQKRIAAMPADRMVNGKPVMSDEKRRALDDQASVLMGAGMGQIVHNRQELMPLLAIMNNRDRDAEIQKALAGAKGQYGESNFEQISSTSAYKVQQYDNAKLFAQTDGLSGVNTGLGKLAEATTDLYSKYPGFGQALEQAKLALEAMAVAALAAGGAALLQSGGSIAGAASTIGRGALGAAGVAGAALPWVAGAAAAGGLGYGAGTLLYKGALEGNGVGDAIGGGVARLLALLGSDDAKAAVGQTDKYDKQVESERAALRAQTQALSAIAARPIKVILDGREIAAAANSYNEFFARRN